MAEILKAGAARGARTAAAGTVLVRTRRILLAVANSLC